MFEIKCMQFSDTQVPLAGALANFYGVGVERLEDCQNFESKMHAFFSHAGAPVGSSNFFGWRWKSSRIAKIFGITYAIF